MKNLRLLLKLARETIKAELNREKLKIDERIKKEFSEKRACFVTLTLDGELRGCIGSLEARQELYLDVIENSRNSAFSDPRFPELSSGEFDKVKIEISILSKPSKINYKSEEELKKKIKGKGVIIKKGYYSATYLPQVWEELNGSDEFLSSLCSKAGLTSNSWRKLDLEIFVYEVQSIKE